MSTSTATATAAERGAARVTGILPQVIVEDIERAVAYYRDNLGFSVDFVYESFYAAVSRDGFAIHLKEGSKQTGDSAFRKQHEHLAAYIAVSGVRDLYNELQGRGANITTPLQERPWSCLDFYVEDPDGNVLCFSELLA